MANLSPSAVKVRPLMGAITSNAVAAEALTAGDLVRATDTGWVKANSTTSAGVKGKLGIATVGEGHSSSGAIANGETFTVHEFGRITLGITLDTTKQYVASTTAGKISDTAIGFARSVGYAEDTAVLFFQPDASQPAS